MASSPNIVPPGEWMPQFLILWKLGVGFCLGISLWGQQPVEKTHASNGTACTTLHGVVFKLAASTGVARGAHSVAVQNCVQSPCNSYLLPRNKLPQDNKLTMTIKVYCLSCFGGSEIQEQFSWVVWAYGLSWGCSQDVSRGHRPLAWLDRGWRTQFWDGLS